MKGPFLNLILEYPNLTTDGGGEKVSDRPAGPLYKLVGCPQSKVPISTQYSSRDPQEFKYSPN